MKHGKTLNELAAEITSVENAKRDFVADTRKLRMMNDGDLSLTDIRTADGLGREIFGMTNHAHHQIAAWAKIPQQYYDRMPSELRAHNINHWLDNEPTKRMVRTLNGRCRAFLSDRYRTLDNYDLANCVLPVLQEVPEMRIESCELTDKRMYLKALFPRIETEVKVGDVVQSGLVISNSETGQGSLRVEPLIFRLVCKNGMISNTAKRRYHVGKKVGELEDALEIYRDETIQADDRAFWLKVQDVVRACVNQDSFEAIVADMRRATELAIEAPPMEVVERTQKHFRLTDGEKTDVLQHLLMGNDLSMYGLMNAITRTAQDVESYDRSTELERIGGKVIELNRTEWTSLAAAA